MTERTTLTFDKETRQRLQTLAARWQVSQAEVVRRAVARAEEAERMSSDPVAELLAFMRRAVWMPHRFPDIYNDCRRIARTETHHRI
ncbi:MAG: hypothetical protein ACREXW_11305 [Gammaproteobacteria bacterium]